MKKTDTNDKQPASFAQAMCSARVDCNLCDECMDDLKVDKTLAWMGHTDEGGGVMCDKCGRMQARMCFRVKPQNPKLSDRT